MRLLLFAILAVGGGGGGGRGGGFLITAISRAAGGVRWMDYFCVFVLRDTRRLLSSLSRSVSQPASQPPSSNLSIFFGMARDVRDAGSMDKKNE